MKDEIIIRKEDVVPYIYFVCSMAQRGRMYGGLNGKSDYIGGIFDRWINIIPESVIFNKYFLPRIGKNISVISDYYKYDPKVSGIAPDVLGVWNDKDAKPFVEYVNKWQALNDAPQIEIKSFKKQQSMISLRNQSYDDKYLVMVETNFNVDYLLPFFERKLFSKKVYKKLKMNDAVFIKRNDNESLSPIKEVTRDSDNLGTLRLILVCITNDFMDYSNHCHANESPFYVHGIKETKLIKDQSSAQPLSKFLKLREGTGLFRWKSNILDHNPKHIMLDMKIDHIENIVINKNSKSSVTVTTKKDAVINGVGLEANKSYIIGYTLLPRDSNNNDEYFMQKIIADVVPSKEKAMLADIKRFIER